MQVPKPDLAFQILMCATVFELHALDHLPLQELYDQSPQGQKIYALLEKCVRDYDMSVLEEAGRMLFDRIIAPPDFSRGDMVEEEQELAWSSFEWLRKDSGDTDLVESVEPYTHRMDLPPENPIDFQRPDQFSHDRLSLSRQGDCAEVVSAQHQSHLENVDPKQYYHSSTEANPEQYHATKLYQSPLAETTPQHVEKKQRTMPKTPINPRETPSEPRPDFVPQPPPARQVQPLKLDNFRLPNQLYSPTIQSYQENYQRQHGYTPFHTLVPMAPSVSASSQPFRQYDHMDVTPSPMQYKAQDLEHSHRKDETARQSSQPASQPLHQGYLKEKQTIDLTVQGLSAQSQRYSTAPQSSSHASFNYSYQPPPLLPHPTPPSQREFTPPIHPPTCPRIPRPLLQPQQQRSCPTPSSTRDSFAGEPLSKRNDHDTSTNVRPADRSLTKPALAFQDHPQGAEMAMEKRSTPEPPPFKPWIPPAEISALRQPPSSVPTSDATVREESVATPSVANAGLFQRAERALETPGTDTQGLIEEILGKLKRKVGEVDDEGSGEGVKRRRVDA